MPQNTESKQNKGADGSNDASSSPGSPTSTSKLSLTSWAKNRWLIIGVASFVLIVGGVLAYWFINREETTNNAETPVAEEELSLAQQIENVELPENATPEEKAQHYSSVAFNYMDSGNTEKAKQYYIAAEMEGFASSRLFSDLAIIYGSESDTAKVEEYVGKLESFIDTNPDSLETEVLPFIKAISVAEVYETIGLNEQAKAKYGAALSEIDKLNDKSLEARKKGIEEKINQL